MPSTWTVRGRQLSLDRPLVMGIINVTPDSFSDGGRYGSVDEAVARAGQLLREGADILDIGGESTRPQGATEVSENVEARRVVPVIERIAAQYPDAVISVDTVKSGIAETAVAAGARIVNDVSAFRLDARMADVCARTGVGVVLMHSRGGISDMASYARATYGANPLDEVLSELQARVDVALSAGIERARIALDPGLGFSKRSGDSLRVVARLDRLAAWGFPIVVGASRKRFIGELTGGEPSERLFGSVGAAVAAYERGAHVLRVHDVAATRQALDVAAAIRAAGAA